MNAEEILKLIETVDPSDTARMDEIDARVWEYARPANALPDAKFKAVLGTSFYCFTRSRDALKAIRPEGYKLGSLTLPCGKASYGIEAEDGFTFSVETDYLPTEELAELHAIIQVIAYERNKKP